ncbi:MAG: HAD family hydrolase [Haloglomus sp.]
MPDRYVCLAFDALAARAGSTPAGVYGPPDDDWAGALCDALAASSVGQSTTAAAVRPHLDLPWHHPSRMHADRPGEDWWRHHESAFADALAAVGVSRREADSVARTVRETYLDPEAWAAVDGAPPALDRLDAADWRPVVYLNGPPEVDDLLAAAGLADGVHEAFTSALTGYERPHARAFETVEDTLGGGRFWFAGRNSDHAAGALDLGIPGVVVGSRGGDGDDEMPPGVRSVGALAGVADLLEGK